MRVQHECGLEKNFCHGFAYLGNKANQSSSSFLITCNIFNPIIGVTVKEDQEEEENFQPSISGGSGQMIGDCTTCGIQLRDWSSTHNHLRFHRLSHVPECIYKVITPLSRR